MLTFLIFILLYITPLTFGYEAETFYFIQIADTHIGFPGADDNLERCLDYIESFEIEPEFLIITGDIVHYGDLPGFLERFSIKCYQQFNSIIDSHNMIDYCCPGNHEYYIGWRLDNYDNYIDYEYNSDNYRYSFTHLNTNFISLNSGSGFWRGNGLTNDDITWVNNVLDNLDGVINDKDDSELNKVIFMHHPIITYNERNNIKLWNFEGIIKNRENFMDLCDKYDVDLVLSGHTHDNHIFKRSDIGNNKDGQTAPIICNETLYVQTADIKVKSAFRKIIINGDEVIVDIAEETP
jgi:3',5'-cyclic AMP phosphodiesterase CpdA